MTTNTQRLITVATALTMLAIVAGNTHAQCCGANTAYYAPTYTTSYYAPQTSYYAPAYTTGYAPAYTSYYSGGYAASYAPAAYTTNYSGGWYPGYWADRVRTRLWGSPTGYVAAYPTTYAAAYAPSTCSTCQSGYVAAYAPASACSSCSTPAVTQASYQPQPSCGCNNTSYTAPAPQSPPAATSPAPYTPPANTDPRPGLDNTPQPTPVQSTTANRPLENTTTPPPAPPQDPATTHPEYHPKKTDNSTYNEAPKLFDPQDRTAQRNIAPVHNALYQQPASYRQVSTAPTVITAEQAQKDAAGWSSVSK